MSNVLKALARGGAAETDPNFKQTVLLLHGDGTNGAQNNTFLDSSSNNFTITRNGNTTQGTFSPFSLAAGEWGNYFDGSGDYLSIADNVAFQFGSGNFTIETWVYRTASANQHIIGSHEDGTAASWLLAILSNNKLRLLVNNSTFLDSSGTVPLNTWSHIAAIRNGNTLFLYINGVAEGSLSFSTSINSNPYAITIGADQNGDEVAYSGYISNLRVVKGTAVYTSAFTPPTTPLTAITNTSLLTCQSNRFVDNSTNAFAITRNGDVRVTPFSPFAPTAAYSAGTNGGSGYFDGTGDYLNNTTNDMKTAMNFGTGDFTIEAWLYFTSSANNQGIIDSASNLSTGALGQWFLYRDGSSKLQFGQHVSGPIATSTATLSTNEWVHVAVSRSGTSLKLFINGVQDGSATNSTNFNAAGSVQVGVVATPLYLTGYISNLRVLKGTALYTSNFTPSTTPLTAITNTALLLNFTNAGIFDQTGKNNLETVGNAQIDTTTKKYGTGSLEFDGTGDYLVAPSNTELTLNADFTIEGWAYLNASGNYRFLTLGDSVGSTGIEIYVGSGNWLVYSNSATRITGAAATRQVWTYLAVVRSGSTVTLYINGTASGSTWSSSASFSGRLFVGAEFFNNGITADTNGFIDDLRITKGVARYTANFTAPTKEFPDL